MLEKLLSNHPRISVLSQPFPFLFIEAKRSFLLQMGRRDISYPLGDLFLEEGYSDEDFARFLAGYRPERGTIHDLFAAMANYSGQYTRFETSEIEAAVNRLDPCDLAATLAYLYRELAKKTSAQVFGGKETICEEFLPFLLSRGCTCVVIVRDPRGMLASLNHGRGNEYGGRLKPSLFNLRNWRKSVAFVLHLRNHPHFVWLRYEDLIARPIEILNRIAEALDVDPFVEDAFKKGIYDQEGNIWCGNSSHSVQDGISAASVDKYLQVLPAALVNYAEAVCYPELRHLGYSLSLEWSKAAEVIAAFKEPYPIERQTLREYFLHPDRIDEEVRRVELLSGSHSAPSHYFLFEDVKQLLREAVIT